MLAAARSGSHVAPLGAWFRRAAVTPVPPTSPLTGGWSNSPVDCSSSRTASSSRPAYSAVPEGLAAIPNIRPTSGKEAAAWIKESLDNYYTRPAEVSYRSQAAWSLRQMDDMFSFLKPDTVVVDLGCFSGGWSEVAIERTYASSSSSLVIGVDMVQMDPLHNHTFIQGNAGDEETLQKVLATLGNRRADVVLSDMAPQTIGLKVEDHLASMECCLFAAKIMERTLRLGGWFIVKMLNGTEQANWRTYLESRFEAVRSVKPPATRSTPAEMFCACRGFLGRRSIAGEIKSRDILKHEGIDLWDAEIRRPS